MKCMCLDNDVYNLFYVKVIDFRIIVNIDVSDHL